MANQRGSAHTSRNQDARDLNPIHEENPISFEEEGPLPKIPSREGYAQRWVRVKQGSEADGHNLYRATRKGWKARSPDTIGKHLQFLTVQREGMGGVIGTHELVLMERPAEINQQEFAHKRKKWKSLDAAVKSDLFAEHQKLGGDATGMTAPSFDSQAHVERGRPLVADD